MDLFFTSIAESLRMCLDPLLLLLIFISVIWGNIGGALPGVGPNLTVAVILPFTFGMTTEQAIACLVAANCACAYGNSIPAILIGVPGTSSAVLTAVDGYALHKQGKSGLALGVQFYAAVFGQFVSIFFFFATVVPLAQLTYIFLAPEMFALYFLGISAVIGIAGDNIVKGLLAAAFGFSISMVGRDPVSAVSRYVYFSEATRSFEITPVVIGLLAVSELFRQMRQSFNWGGAGQKITAKFPPWKTLWNMTPRILMGCAIGAIVGAIPGIGGTTAAFISYTQAKIWSKHPELFGHGAIDGIAANESAQNASQSGEMVPTFGLGIPGSSTMVLLFAAMLMHGFIPGPMLIKQAPQLLYAAGAGLWATTAMLVIIGWPICMVLYKIVTIDRTTIIIGALALCMLGVWTINNSSFDVLLMLAFGIIGYFMMRYGYPVAAAAITIVLGRGFEGYLRRGLIICGNNFWEFVSRPWTALILIICIALLVYGTIGTIRLARKASEIKKQQIMEHLAGKPAS
jgi:putative tricarboxylic transport membrane protein